MISQGDDAYRRGLYTFWRRTSLHPMFALFDAPSREECTVLRPRTNTPLQALVTLNDPTFVEAAGAFARRVLTEGPADLDGRIRFAFRTALARPPGEREVQVLTALHQRLLEAPVKNLFCKAGRAWLKTLCLDPAGQAMLESDLRLLAAVEEDGVEGGTQCVNPLPRQSLALQSDQIQPLKAGMITPCHSVGDDVIGHARHSANESVSSDAAMLLDRGQSTDIDTIINRNVSSQSDAIGKCDIVSNTAVVADVTVRHEVATSADTCDTPAP